MSLHEYYQKLRGCNNISIFFILFQTLCSKYFVLYFFNQIWVNVPQELWLENQPVSDYSEIVIISQEKITSKICLFQSCADVYLSLENFQSMNELEKLRMLLKKVHTVLSPSVS